MRTPVLVTPWRRLVTDDQHHFNDFCLFPEREGAWHAIGIMGHGEWASEQQLFHASGPSLDEPMTLGAPLLTAMPSKELAPQKHAPYVIERNGVHHMFYRRPPGTIMVAQTRDPDAWPSLGEEVFSCRDARDNCILHIGGLYHMYYCQWESVDGVGRSTIQLRTSRDLAEWSAAKIVHVDTRAIADHSYLESPFVVAESDGYYLFVRHRLFNANELTIVLHSNRPDEFPSGEKAWFAELPECHAPEIVRWRDRWWIARVSGPWRHMQSGAPRHGWVDITELAFV